jgi:hypothetical protein
VGQERADQRRIEVSEIEAARRRAGPLLREAKEQAQ